MTRDERRGTNDKVQKSKYVKNCNLFLFNYKNMKRELFAQCIPYDENIKGRIGGNPPIAIESKIPERYGFYATLVHPDKEDKMLSILITKDLDKLVNNSIYPSIDIKVIEHEYSIMSTHSENSLENFNNKMFSIGEYTKEKDSKFLFIKVGGEPRFIQNKEFYYKQLLEDNYSFFLMIDEEGYIEEAFDDVFNFGALYLYKHNDTKEIIAGFWQCS